MDSPRWDVSAPSGGCRIEADSGPKHAAVPIRRHQAHVTKKCLAEPFSAHPNPWSHPWDRVGRAAGPCPVGGTLSTTPVDLVVDVPDAWALRGLLHGVTVDDGDPVPAAVFQRNQANTRQRTCQIGPS